MIKSIRTKRAPEPGAYSQAKRISHVHDLLQIAGVTGNDPYAEGQLMVEGGIGPQTMQTLQNILAIVEDAGGTVESITRMVVLLKDPGTAQSPATDEDYEANFLEMNAAYKAFFGQYGIDMEKGNLPVRTTAWVSKLPSPGEGTLVEIQADAALPVDM